MINTLAYYDTAVKCFTGFKQCWRNDFSSNENNPNEEKYSFIQDFFEKNKHLRLLIIFNFQQISASQSSHFSVTLVTLKEQQGKLTEGKAQYSRDPDTN
jgi:hypothetical protein